MGHPGNCPACPCVKTALSIVFEELPASNPQLTPATLQIQYWFFFALKRTCFEITSTPYVLHWKFHDVTILLTFTCKVVDNISRHFSFLQLLDFFFISTIQIFLSWVSIAKKNQYCIWRVAGVNCGFDAGNSSNTILSAVLTHGHAGQLPGWLS
jgi:hypothetical protein